MNNNIKEIYSLLKNKRIKEALMKIEDCAKSMGEWTVWEESDKLLVSYDMMLKYSLQGIKDPNKKNMIKMTSAKAYELTDMLNVMEYINSSSSYYANIFKSLRDDNHSINEIRLQLEKYTEDLATVDIIYQQDEINDKKIEIAKRHEENISLLFNKIYTSIKWNDNEYKQIEELFSSLLVPNYDKAILLSAIMQSLLHIFDEKKCMILFSAYNDEDTLISQRALISLIIVLQIKPERINNYPEIIARLSLLKEEKRFVNDLMTIQLQLLMALETDNIEKKMREEIIPEMIKGTSNHFLYEEDKENENPDWEKMMEDSDFSDKIKEMNELQLSGADIYMGSFSLLKHYRFFFDMHHWFYPFFKQQIDIINILNNLQYNKTSIINLTLSSIFFCNSDKYSLCFTLNNIPNSQRSMFIKQLSDMGDENIEHNEMLKKLTEGAVKKEVVCRQYIQDLYRFFKLWHHKNEGIDIFKNDFDLWNNPFFKESMNDVDKLSKIGAFLLKYNNMGNAYYVYKAINSLTPEDAESWQKQGYALQKMKRYDEAIKCYMQSDMLKPDNQWTIHHLAQCYKKNGNYKKAIEYYKKIEALKPDNLVITGQIGQCLINDEKYEEALQYFYKIHYIDENSISAQRAIAWCMLQTGNIKESEKYFSIIVNGDNGNYQDYINLGHLYMILGNIMEATNNYKIASDMLKDNNKFIEILNNDKQLLINHGIKNEDIDIIPDLLI